MTHNSRLYRLPVELFLQCPVAQLVRSPVEGANLGQEALEERRAAFS